ncbi:hypothetical protein PF008_g17728 [Phytophthora fragariae]|uniref:Uncharacterized protein n=1 Tax=Phytophthora fragariae TaxID=53985 RepID=A0A6G0R7F4_9STRA|nr:hypothetical protein PF008_g17728 [Phytophthora fragariae]
MVWNGETAHGLAAPGLLALAAHAGGRLVFRQELVQQRTSLIGDVPVRVAALDGAGDALGAQVSTSRVTPDLLVRRRLRRGEGLCGGELPNEPQGELIGAA